MARWVNGPDLVAALLGACGIFIVGFFGSEILFGPGAEGVALEATLLPSLAAAIGGFFYFLNEDSGLLVGDRLDHVEAGGPARGEDRGDQAEHEPRDADPDHRRHRRPIDHSRDARRQALKQGRS